MRLSNLYMLICVALLGSCASHKLQETQVETLIESTMSWDGAALPYYPEGQPKITVLRITIPPGTALETHYHPVINSGVLLKGSLTVVDEDGNTLILQEGDALVELVNKLHHGKNEGKRPAVILVFYAGTTDLPIVLKE